MKRLQDISSRCALAVSSARLLKVISYAAFVTEHYEPVHISKLLALQASVARSNFAHFATLIRQTRAMSGASPATR